MKAPHKIFRIGLIMLLIISMHATASGVRKLWIMNRDGMPVSGVVVGVINQNDSTIMDASVSDANGILEISDSLIYETAISARCIGYDNYEGNIPSNDTLVLTPSTHNLEGITIIASKDLIRREAGKFIFTPGNLKSEVNNGFDLLRFVPLINSSERNIEILGKRNCLIYINGKDTHLPKEQILNELKAIPSKWIKSVEIITSPGGTVSASSAVGIINVNLVDRTSGILGSLQLSGTFGEDTYNTYDRFTLSFNKRNFRGSAFLYYMDGPFGIRSKSEYTFINPEKENENIIDNQFHRIYGKGIGGNVGLLYEPSERIQLGISAGLSDKKNNELYETTTLESSAKEPEQYSSGTTNSNSPMGHPAISLNAFYSQIFDEAGSHLDISGGFRHQKSLTDVRYDFNSISRYQFLSSDCNGGVADIKYRHFFNRDHSVAAGYNFSRTNIEDRSKLVDISNDFDYHETLHCGFIQWGAMWSSTFSTMLGLRIEHAITDGNIPNGERLFSRRDTDFFPSLSISWSIPAGFQNISLDISRLIYRPQFEDLNPFVIWTSSNSCTKGNPEIEAAKIWNVNLYYSFLQNYILGVSYSYSNPENTLFKYGENGISVTTRINAGHSHRANILFQYNNLLLNLWRVNWNVTCGIYDTPLFLEGKDYSTKSITFQANLLNRLQLSRYGFWPDIQIKGQFGYWGASVSGGSTPICNLDISLFREIFKGFETSLGLKYDLGNYYNQKLSYQNYIYIKKITSSPFTAYLNISYTFGNTKIKKYQDIGDSSYDSRYK